MAQISQKKGGFCIFQIGRFTTKDLFDLEMERVADFFQLLKL